MGERRGIDAGMRTALRSLGSAVNPSMRNDYRMVYGHRSGVGTVNQICLYGGIPVPRFLRFKAV